MSTYAPGTVAVIYHEGEAFRAVKDEKGWASLAPEIGWVPDVDVTDIHPLVVLDLKGWPDAAELIRGSAEESSSVLLRHIADQIEAQTKPPRIPEPGLWGVVEAEYAYERRPRMPRFYLRDSLTDEDGDWVIVNGSGRSTWDDLIDPTLIREGVSEP